MCAHVCNAFRFQLYQKEKLRKKMQPRLQSAEETTPKQRRKKSERRETQLNTLRSVLSVLVQAVTFSHVYTRWYNDNTLQATDSIGSGGTVVGSNATDSSSPSDAVAWVVNLPPEVLISTVCCVCLLVLSFVAFRWLANLNSAKNSDSFKLKQHTVLTLLLSASLFCYYLLILICYIQNFYADPEASGLIHVHTLLRIYEVFHSVLILIILASPSLSLKAQFPSNSREITQDWLTSVLRDNGTIKSTTTVVAFSTETLRGGCHFKVSRVSMRYSVEKADDPHKTIVVKLLSWDKPIWERVVLFFQLQLGSLEREALYLRSYQIESLFYKHQTEDLQGLLIPEIYYNLQDCFNHRFGMVLQDLSTLEDGQPLGFSRLDAELCLSHLARFHASNWHQRSLSFTGWDIAGYWTGDKREGSKRKAGSSWDAAVANFPSLKLNERFPRMGALLAARLDWLEKQFDQLMAPEYTTLCHGDYKITNLFLSRLKPESKKPRSVYAIDWQWFGVGNCCIDTAYLLFTSLQAEAIADIPHLLMYYYHALCDAGVTDYDLDTYMHHYHVVLVDFCAYAIVAKWAKMTIADFRQYEQKQKDGLHLRSIPHMESILQETYTIITNWERTHPLH
jgi:thiamine kinase-like enzyme